MSHKIIRRTRKTTEISIDSDCATIARVMPAVLELRKVEVCGMEIPTSVGQKYLDFSFLSLDFSVLYNNV